MAEKELRKMNRTELIEIIYALQQNDRTLQQENEELRRQLEDKMIRIEQSGSIAEAALSLNHIFEDAEAAAKQYLESIRTADKSSGLPMEQTPGQTPGTTSAEEDTQQECNHLMEKAQQEHDRILKDALLERDHILEITKKDCDRRIAKAELECDRLREKTKQECDTVRTAAEQESRNRIDTLNREIEVLINKYPLVRDYLKREFGTGAGTGGDST